MTTRLANLYTPLDEAAHELRRRRLLRQPSITCPLEDLLAANHFAVLFRQIATPNLELARFISLATACGLTPLILEFHLDKFVTRNSYKYALARMGFFNGKGRKGGPRVQYLSAAHLPTADGQRLDAVITVWGQPLIAFHHELLSLSVPDSRVSLVDGTDWFRGHGSNARDYYADFLSLFISHAVLFESFLLPPHEEDFTTEIVVPSFAEASLRHQLRPLICRLDPADAEGDPLWYWYRYDLFQHVKSRFLLTSGAWPCQR